MSIFQTAIMAGFGGQGILFIGNLLAQAGMEHGLNVTYIPVYGVEMRGGTANCTVVISSDPIGSPIVKAPLATILLNQPSLDKFQSRLAPEGVQIVNASLVATDLLDSSKKTVHIPVNEMAREIGNPKLINMVALGAFLKATQCIPLDAVKTALRSTISSHYAHLIPQNEEALDAGYTFA